MGRKKEKLGDVKRAVVKAFESKEFPNIAMIASAADCDWRTAKTHLLELENQGYCSLDKVGNQYVVSASAKLLNEVGVD